MGRTPCCDNRGLKKGPWTSEEDQKLINYIQNHGPGNWRALPKNAELERCGKSCRLRWTNYLRPDIKRGRFSFEEEETIIQLHSIMGNKWSAIAARLPGRTDNEIKNYWNTHIRKRLLKMGIDPVTHAPRLDLDLSSILSSALSCNPSLFNMSSLIGTQALINPEWLKLLSNFLSLKTDNSELFSEDLQHTQLGSNVSQLQSQFPTLQNINNDQFQTPITQAPNMEGFFSNISNFSSDMSSLQEINSMSSYLSESHVPHQTYAGLQGNPSLQDQSNYINHHHRSYDSVLSTPLSSPTPLNSSSTHVNSTTEDERDSYCSNLFKFEIPESLDISDLL